jgi:glutathione S-transferase
MAETARPILYSFRRCPYAMRARMAILASGITVELREVVLRDKPPELLEASPKATVPVLILPDGHVIDQSVDIMHWALAQNDPEGWLSGNDTALIEANDGPFKAALDRYKYPHRYDLTDGLAHRTAGMEWLSNLDVRLNKQQALAGQSLGITDFSIFPFIRQFAMTDWDWFINCPMPALRMWLNNMLETAYFNKSMQRYAQWEVSNNPVYFGANALAEIQSPA